MSLQKSIRITAVWIPGRLPLDSTASSHTSSRSQLVYSYQIRYVRATELLHAARKDEFSENRFHRCVDIYQIPCSLRAFQRFRHFLECLEEKKDFWTAFGNLPGVTLVYCSRKQSCHLCCIARKTTKKN